MAFLSERMYYPIVALWCLLDFLIFVNGAPHVLGIYSLDEFSSVEVGGGIKVEADRRARLRLIGTGFNNTEIFFTPSNTSCHQVRRSDSFYTTNDSDSSTAILEVNLPPPLQVGEYLYMCLSAANTKYHHQGLEKWLTITVFTVAPGDGFLLPLWLQISIIVILLLFSGLFSGLNLGLMSLDQTELKIIAKVGSDSEKRCAERISPLRKRGNLLLCTLLLGNVLVNSLFTILFDDLTNGLVAVICSTLGIVLFGEIIPQAICSRHGLAVGANTYWITVFFMIVTFPLSFPISFVLDKILGEEMGQVYSKEKLQELIRMTADRRVLHDNEANIISGALQLTNKSVEDVMTKVDDVFMLEINTVLEFEKLTEIMHQGYTRVPVYDGDKTNIVNLLNTKDLALIDPDDRTILSTVCKFYDHKPLFVDYDVKLDAMLQEFLHGNSHMAIVQKLHNTEDHDPYFETVGVITLEDVIEEILQSEIVDETDLKTDNRQKEVRTKKRDYGVFVPDEQRSALPKQLAFVAFQFLTTNVEPFSETYLARNVLRNLMKKDIVVNLSPTEPVSKKNYIYEKGVQSDKFVLILQGTVEVEIGGENMIFESGPFTFFAVEYLNNLRRQSVFDSLRVKEYIPDFSVRAITDVQYLSIRRAQYLAALRTTKMLRQGANLAVNDAFEAEYEKAIKTNSNRNSMLENHSPPPNTPLEYLKYDESGKKKSTSSLDRLTFFHRKHDPLESLYRMRRTGSDAKEHNMEYYEDLGGSVRKNNIEVRPSRSSGDNSSTITPASPSAENKKLLLNPLFSGKQTEHEAEVYKENDLSEVMSQPPAEEKLAENTAPTSPPFNRGQSLGFTTVEVNGSDAKSHKPQVNSAEEEAHEAVPLIEIKSTAAKNATNPVGKGSPTGFKTSKDAECIPLMNYDTSPDTNVL